MYRLPLWMAIEEPPKILKHPEAGLKREEMRRSARAVCRGVLKGWGLDSALGSCMCQCFESTFYQQHSNRHVPIKWRLLPTTQGCGFSIYVI